MNEDARVILSFLILISALLILARAIYVARGGK